MKKTMLAAAVLVIVACAFITPAESRQSDEVGPFMRVKLTHSQKVLEGLTREDYSMIGKHAQQLSLLSRSSTWEVLHTLQYRQHSGEFRRAADALTAAAEKKNIDAAALAYLDVTLKCINCHKYVRNQRTKS